MLSQKMAFNIVSPKDVLIIGRPTATGTIGGSKHQQTESVNVMPHHLTNGGTDHSGAVRPSPVNCNCIPPPSKSSAKAAREKALQEIRISLQPFANNERPFSNNERTFGNNERTFGNNERPTSSASSTSDSSSSPGQTSGIGSSVSSNQSGLIMANHIQLVQQLHNISLSSSGNRNVNLKHSSSINTNQYHPQSPASLSSLYSSISSPPQSYAASSSSGRQSPTPTISSSSDYSTVPPPIINANIMKKLSSGSSSTGSSSHTPTSSSGVRPVQAWTARQAISQSPVIMQSVKSTQVQKPVLQTAVAPTTPPLLNAIVAQKQTASVVSGHSISGHSIGGHSISTHSINGPSINGHSISGHSQHAMTPHYPNGPVSSNPTASHRNPPPYPSYAGQKHVNGPRAYAHAAPVQDSYQINPPPSYASAVQQQQQQQQITVPQETGAAQSSSPPPPPPPPPYSASLPVPQEPQMISVLSQYRSEFTPPPIQIPTIDPPSYASSVAALAAQRMAIAFACSNVQSQSSNSAVTVTSSSRSNNLTNLQLPLPSRPAPMPPAMTHAIPPSMPQCNSDLVNTVESICTSQISALQGVSSCANAIGQRRQMDIVPPLPPKPNSMASNLSESCSSDTSSYHSSSNHSSNACRPMMSSSSNSNNTNSGGNNGKTTHQSPIPPRKQWSKEKEKERRESKVKNYSPAAFKFFMEQHVENVIKSHQQRERRRQQLESEMAKVGLSEEAQCQMRRMLHQKESNYIRLRRAKMDRSMFKKIKTIGVGAFGEVALVKKVDANQLYAMKTLRKEDVLKRNQVAHVKAERDILAEADNEWVVKLYYSFQDANSLYFVMDYIPGGDLMSLLIKFGIFQETLARFYIAELALAVESVHKMGFIHRDIKPDNILIDRDGHIKLTDFGLCTGFRWTHNSKYYQRNNGVDVHNRQDSMDFVDENWSNNCHCNCNSNKPLERRRRREHQRCLAHSLVGTPNYIAPEVLMRTGYTQLCDWWSVGVILYEMLVGSPPFFANTPEETQNKVIHWDKTLNIPDAAELQLNAKDLILRLCCGPEDRLGKNGAEEIKKHTFFNGLDFEGGFRKQPAPYIPEIKYPTDTSNFDPIDPDKLHPSGSDGNSNVNVSHSTYDDYINSSNGQFQENGKHPEHAFFEFTFRRFFDDGGNSFPIKITDNSSNNTNNTNNSNNNAGNGQGFPVYV